MSSTNSFVEPRVCYFHAEFCFYQSIAQPNKRLGTQCRNKMVDVQVRYLFYEFFFYDFLKRIDLMFVTIYRL